MLGITQAVAYGLSYQMNKELPNVSMPLLSFEKIIIKKLFEYKKYKIKSWLNLSSRLNLNLDTLEIDKFKVNFYW